MAGPDQSSSQAGTAGPARPAGAFWRTGSACSCPAPGHVDGAPPLSVSCRRRCAPSGGRRAGLGRVLSQQSRPVGPERASSAASPTFRSVDGVNASEQEPFGLPKRSRSAWSRRHPGPAAGAGGARGSPAAGPISAARTVPPLTTVPRRRERQLRLCVHPSAGPNAANRTGIPPWLSPAGDKPHDASKRDRPQHPPPQTWWPKRLQHPVERRYSSRRSRPAAGRDRAARPGRRGCRPGSPRRGPRQ